MHTEQHCGQERPDFVFRRRQAHRLPEQGRAEVTIVRHQPFDYASHLSEALQFTRTFAAGLFLTWVASIVLTTGSARADDQVGVQAAPHQAEVSVRPMSGGDYVTNKSAAIGSGLLESSLSSILRRATPISASEPARAVESQRHINHDVSQALAVDAPGWAIIQN